jgi:hypothetical protein
MSTTLPPVPHMHPLVDINGVLTQPWALWLQTLFLRTGGNIAPSNDELEEVGTDRLEDLAVTTAKLANSAVTADKITAGVIAFSKFLSSDWTSSKTANGYTKLPNGIYLQWGATAAGIGTAGVGSIVFPLAFPTACLQVIASVRDNGSVGTGTTGQFGTGNYSTTGFDLYNRTSGSLNFNWFAIGH